MSALKLPFIKSDWSVSISDIPKYPELAGKFTQPLDYHILQMFLETNSEKITPIMKQEVQDKLLKNIDQRTGELSVFHHQTYGLGRFYANDNVSLIPFSKYIKHTLFKYLGWRDIDMVKGHMTIAYEMGLAVGLSFTSIKFYIDNFSIVCDEIRQFYQLDESENYLEDEDIKWLFCLMMYGGGLECWVRGLAEGDEKSGHKPKRVRNPEMYSKFAREYKAESKRIIDRIYTKNSSLVRKLKQGDDEEHDTKKRVASYWFQIIENHILWIVYCFMCEQKVIKPRVCGLEYDGLCLPPLDKSIDESALIQDINTIIRIKTGMTVLMKFKDYSPNFVLDEIIKKRLEYIPPVYAVAVEDIAETDSTSREYIEWKKTFELEYCKIKNSAVFIRRYVSQGKSSLIFHTEKAIVTAEKQHCFYKTDEKGKQRRVSYISEWLLDPKMRCYESVQCIPPPLVCPSGVFNLWIPSPYEDQEIRHDDPDFDLDAIKIFTEHIEILSGRNEETFKYIINWVAHSIQRPAEKIGVVLNFISDEGVGKNIFTNVLGKLYGGGSKKLETAHPERDVWGPFNELLTDAFLVVLSETDKRNSAGHDGKIKAFVTDATITINPKGKTGFTTDSYHRCILNTNNADPTPTSKGDRRNVIIRCSDEKKGDTKYFEDLLEALRGPNALRSIYWTFKTLDIAGFGVGSKIKTEYHAELIGHNMNPLELFMRWIVETNTGVINLSSTDLLGRFVSWKEMTRFKFGENMNVLSLVKQLSLQLKLPKDAFYCDRTADSRMRVIDTVKLASFYGIKQMVGVCQSEYAQQESNKNPNIDADS